MNRFKNITGETTSHSTRLPNDGNQVAGYKPVLWSVALLLTAFMAGCGGGGGGGIAADTTAPTVTSTIPLDVASGVARNANITAKFSEAMDAATITNSTFTLKQGASAVTGVVSYAGTTATFNPTSNLLASKPYTATITTGVKDAAGNALAANKVWSFTTGATTDSTAPTVSSTSPIDTASGVAANANITATFSEAMNAASITTATFTLMQGASSVSGTVAYSGTTATFNPTSNLAASTVYTAKVFAGVVDLSGNALAANKVWTFTTGIAADNTAPTVSSTLPADVDTGVAVGSAVSATFSEAMDASTISTDTFTLQRTGPPLGTLLGGTVAYDVPSKVATLTPTSALVSGTNYTATITTGAKDQAGNALAANKVWTFTTVAAPGVGNPGPVLLGTAINYAILTKTGVSTVPTSIVTGHVGVSPAARGYLTGWSETYDVTDTYAESVQATGFKLYAADLVGGTTSSDLTVAVLDMQTAYTDAAGRTATSAATVDVGAGTLTGLTLTRGVYEWGSNVTIPTDLTLDGSATDVWIFKIAGTLTMAANKNVILSGGALAKNIFWQVSEGVTIGTGTHFEGVILGMTAITFDTGSSINGRLLAQTAVVLRSTTVTQPAP